jgi:hypothetical protein
MISNDRANAQLSRGTVSGSIAGVTATAAEVNVLGGVTAGTVLASGGVVVDSNKDIASFRNVTGVNYDAGASGTAGTLDVFPTTAAKGKNAFTATDNTGNTINTITNAAQATTRTFTIPDPGASANFSMMAIQAGSADGAITIKDGFVPLTKAGVAAMTLAAPTATTDDGKILRIVATTANAHTVTQASDGFNGGGASKDVATFGGAVGDKLVCIAYQGIWYILDSLNITLA